MLQENDGVFRKMRKMQFIIHLGQLSIKQLSRRRILVTIAEDQHDPLCAFRRGYECNCDLVCQGVE